MRVTRVSVRHEKLVYVIVTDKKFTYPNGQRSRVAYIGTTKKGVERIAQSAAWRTDEILGWRGVEEFQVRIVACRSRNNVKTWRVLERALLIRFREMYGRIPWCNTQGNKMKRLDELEYFAESRITRVLEDLA